MAIDPKTDLPITLQADEWNVVLDVLADGRHRVVAGLIAKIVEQAQRQQNLVEQLPHTTKAESRFRPVD